MKKIFIAIAALAAMTFASCGGSTSQAEGADSIAVDSAVVEETNVVEATEQAEALITDLTQKVQAGNTNSIVEKVKEAALYVQTLAANGDTEAVKAYTSKLKEFVEANKDKLDQLATEKTTISELITKVASTPAEAENVLNQTAEALGADAETVKEAANALKDAAKTKVDEKANEAANAAKAKAEEKVNAAVEDAKSKAYEKGKEAGENAKKALNDAADEAKKKLGF